MTPLIDAAEDCRPLWLVREQDADRWTERLPGEWRARAERWARAQGFRGERSRVLSLPAADGSLAGAALGLGKLGALAELLPTHLQGGPDRLPAGRYALAEPLPPAAATHAALGWALGSYRFERYRRGAAPATPPVLAWPPGADRAQVGRLAAADALARDLVNTPAQDLGPPELAAAIAAVAHRYGAEFREVVGEALLAERLPAIHAVGRAASRPPRLAELRHGTSGPRVTLVGKGVCFDTGGLDLKPSSGMALMKKDMGGAAAALALAQLVLDARLPVQLRLLVPAVENSVGSDAFRPGDVLATRAGLTVEVTNTDAEGRLVLADALALAGEQRPDLVIDLATLTGAARVALGPELPALYGSDEALVAELLAHGRAVGDPLWPMPLWSGYEDELASKIADLVNAPSSGFAGSIAAGLFLRRFVPESTPWLHVDLYAWNGKERPGRPVGAEMQAVRALYALLRARYGGGAG
ncbi:MAG: leucyl aminopeptidase family protein [Proteobacteria bacterium]|nr:leucyl aminopeptidase family protein [Pseudomonadota bacterium]